MQLKALIFEQLDADGTLRTFRMQADPYRSLVVSFPDEYDEPRTGPFHFLDEEDEIDYDRGFAECSTRALTSKKFRQTERGIYFENYWQGIPTHQYEATFYVLMLPEFAIPISVEFTDPLSKKEYYKTVVRDDDNNRFNIYLQCYSEKGPFSFSVKTEFVIDHDRFKETSFSDETTADGWRVTYHDWLHEEQATKVSYFFNNGDVVMRDQYNVRDINGSNVIINASLKDATLSINAAKNVNAAQKQQLTELIEELKTALQKLPDAQKEAAETLSQYVKGLFEEGLKPQPNKSTITVNAENLKAAAKAVADVMPTVLTISISIVRVISELTGVPLALP